MDDKSRERETSHAKNIELESDKQKALDRAVSLQQAFEKAKAAQGKSLEQQKAESLRSAQTMPREGSSMVKKQALIPDGPKAPQNARQPQKDQEHINDLGNERSKANEHIASVETAAKNAVDRQDQQKKLGLENERDKDNDDRSR